MPGHGTLLRQTGKGFTISAAPGGKPEATFVPGFKVTKQASAEPGVKLAKIKKSAVLGLTGVDPFPTYEGENLTDAEIPYGEGNVICIRIEIVPESSQIPGTGTSDDNPTIYELNDSFESEEGFTIVTELGTDETIPEINATDGAVTKNGIYYLPLAEVINDTFRQYVYGPVSATYCTGRIIWQPPVIITTASIA